MDKNKLKLISQTNGDLVFKQTSELEEMSSSEKDNYYMQIAILLSKNCSFYPDREFHDIPHPKVGVVIVKDDVIIMTAYKGQLNYPFNSNLKTHAEYIAFKTLARQNRIQECDGATLYSTLEPCSYRTEKNLRKSKLPCSENIVKNKIARVVIGMIDPDPQISGKGIAYVKENGIQVDLLDGFQEELFKLNNLFIEKIKSR